MKNLTVNKLYEIAKNGIVVNSDFGAVKIQFYDKTKKGFFLHFKFLEVEKIQTNICQYFGVNSHTGKCNAHTLDCFNYHVNTIMPAFNIKIEGLK